MVLNSLSKNVVALSLAGVLGGCSATSAGIPAGIMGTVAGLAAVGIGKVDNRRDDKNDLFEGFLEAGPIYRSPLVNKVSNVPLEIRNVPIHPSDPWGRPGPIEDDEVKVGARSGMFLRYGPKLNLIGEHLSLKMGLELEISGLFVEDPERNYTNAVGTEQRGYGAALTYYSVHTKAGPDWNSVFIPKIFAGVETKLSDSFSIGAGYSIWREDLVAETGYDRYDKYDRLAGFNLVDMTVGSISGSLRYHPSESGNFYFIEVGTQDILDKKYHELGREAEIDFEKDSFTLSIGGRLTF